MKFERLLDDLKRKYPNVNRTGYLILAKGLYNKREKDTFNIASVTITYGIPLLALVVVNVLISSTLLHIGTCLLFCISLYMLNIIRILHKSLHIKHLDLRSFTYFLRTKQSLNSSRVLLAIFLSEVIITVGIFPHDLAVTLSLIIVFCLINGMVIYPKMKASRNKAQVLLYYLK